jgi:4-aminobutyrate aminotransferase-like enzyme/Ser/Thr protein kinase RdoA (MazF antagonist)
MTLRSPDFESGASAVPPSRVTAESIGYEGAGTRREVGGGPGADPGTRLGIGGDACTIAGVESTAGAAGDDVLQAPPPRFDPEEAATIAADVFGVRGTATPLVSERDQNFRIVAEDGTGWVLKLSNSGEREGVVEMEVGVVRHAAAVDASLPVALPRATRDGTPWGVVPGAGGARHFVRLLPVVPGRHGAAVELSLEAIRDFGAVSARLGRATRGYFHPAAGRPILWDVRHLATLRPHLPLVGDGDRRALVGTILDRFEAAVLPALAGFRAQVIHNDLTFDNTLLDPDGRISGIIDFGDMAHTALVLDLVAALVALLGGRDDPADLFAAAEAAIAGYAAVTPLEDAEAALLGDLVAARLAQTTLISAWRVRLYPENAEYLASWDAEARPMLALLGAVGLDEVGGRFAAAARRIPAWPIPAWPSPAWPSPAAPSASAGGTVIADAELRARRGRVLGTALSALTYERPLHLVRGEGARMFDPDGRAYLDAYNNVPVVGHSHPRVVAAIARQAATLNTNTRYLHRTVVELAERLVATMPPGLDTVMFVNSGSEANDLAWRLATTVTGRRGAIVTDWAYHGISAAIADLSPEEWPRGQRPAHVATIPPPDTYRRPAIDGPGWPELAAARLDGALADLEPTRAQPAVVCVDGAFTSDGIFAPPAGYLRELVRRTREAGALFIADEVQAGHGRMGDGLWSFEAAGIVPDLVTLGKPMGNGHPVAAVVTRADIVDRFAVETEFFSTFGGNPVACAAAMAVLDIIEDEDLVANAAGVGEEIRRGIRQLAEHHPAIGDVRGRGLMIGVELVADPAARTPDARLASRVQNAMRDRGVLVGTTARAGNVLKIRPPLVVTRDDAALLLRVLEEALVAAGPEQVPARPVLHGAP